MTAATTDQYQAGAAAALQAFLDEMVANRGLIENEDEPVFDVIVDLLKLSLQEVQR